MTLMERRSHIVGLDILRFLAASAVVVFHLAYWAHATNFFAHSLVRGYGDFPALARIVKNGWIGVPIFFVISGYVIAYSAQSATPLAFAISRVVRLFPSMFICSTIILTLTLSSHLNAADLALDAYFRSIFFFPFGPYIDDSIWTLGIEVVFYFLVWALLLKSAFSKIRTLSLVIGSLSLCYWVAVHFHVGDSTLQLVTKRVLELLLLQHGVYFAIGVLVWLSLSQTSKSNIPWVVLFLFGGVLQIAGEVAFHEQVTGNQTGMLVPVSILVLFIVAFAASIRWNSTIHGWLSPGFVSASRTLGLMTYPLYLIHQTTGAYALGRMAEATRNPYFSLLVVLAGCLLVAWFVATVFEPPLQRLTRRALYRLSARLSI